MEKGLAEASKKVKAFGATIAAIGAGIAAAGAVITAPFLEGLHVFADMGSEMLDMSQRTGVAVEALSELVYVAEQSGSSAAELEVAFKGMAKVISGAAGGSQQSVELLNSLGLSVSDLSRLTQDARFELFAQKLSEIDDPSLRAAKAMEIFGKAGLKMLPAMADGAAGIKALREEAIRLGIQMSSKDAAEAEAIGDQFSSIAKQVKMMWFNIGAAIAPLAKQFLGIVQEIMARVVAWVRENRALLMIIFQVGGALVAAGTAISAAGGLIYGFGVVLSSLGLVFAAITSPIGLTIGAIALLGAGVYALSQKFPEAFSGVSAEITKVGVTFAQVWGGMANAMSAGEFGLAWEIALKGLELAWANTKGKLQAVSVAVAGSDSAVSFMTAWDDAYSWCTKVFVNISTALRTALNTAIWGIRTAWAYLVEEMKVSWETLQNTVNPLRSQATTNRNIQQATIDRNAALRAANQDFDRDQATARVDAARTLGRDAANRITAPNLRAGADLALRDQQAGNNREQEAIQRDLAAMNMDAWFRSQVAEVNRQMAATPPGGPETAGPGGSSTGTLSAAAIGFMSGGSDPMTEVAKNTRDANALLQDLLGRMNNMQAVME